VAPEASEVLLKSRTNELLGYRAHTRLLIVNADDFGMCHAVNVAIAGALGEGVVRSTTLMVPCPWMLHAVHFLAAHPEIPFGIHLTAISEWVDYRWGPVMRREEVPSLVDEAGFFHTFDEMAGFLAAVKLDELEKEFRAQIEVVLGLGLRPTHLDWHALRIDARPDIAEVMFRLAREYGLALRVRGGPAIAMVQDRGLPCVDYDFLDSYGLDPATKASRFAEAFHELPPGLSEWAVHPGLDTPELVAIERGVPRTRTPGTRQADFDFFTSEEAKELVRKEGIILLDYRALQAVWQSL
jgi:chitin disaccharide deacetylase